MGAEHDAEALPMRRCLRACLLALVVLNLVFVQISGGVESAWMLPLFALALASPVLVRWQESFVYRLVWNAGVLAIFAILVRHALFSGVRFLLEDGLILAAFCQVHLLNNLGRRQKPDLLFFNSFLIALVTSFFCQDVVFAAVFAVYAFALTFGLQLSCTREHGLPHGLLRDGAGKAGVALAATLAVFLVWPRDFNREGLVGETLRGGVMQVGYTENVELGQSARTVASGRVVMRIRIAEGTRGDVPEHWRGATFQWYDGNRWHPDDRPQSASEPALADPWLQPRPLRWLRAGEAPRARVRVELEGAAQRLFAPLEASQLDLDASARDLLLLPRVDGTWKYAGSLAPGGGGGEVRYELRLRGPPADHGATARQSVPAELLPLLRPSRGLPSHGRALAARLAAQHKGAPQHEVVEAMRRWLAESLAYLPPGAQGAARDLDEFLSGTAGGHCEYFATALALMLRSEGIPCRLVTGYLCTEWDESETVLTVRSKHAHAWVEVFDPLGYWYAVDPSPAAAAAGAVASWSERSWAAVTAVWNAIAGFDDQARARALAWLKALPGRAVAWVSGRPGETALYGVLLLGAAALVRWVVRRRGVPAVRAYLRAVARAGMVPGVGETPREVLARARAQNVRAEAVERLALATDEHERARYGR